MCVCGVCESSKKYNRGNLISVHSAQQMITAHAVSCSCFLCEAFKKRNAFVCPRQKVKQNGHILDFSETGEDEQNESERRIL